MVGNRQQVRRDVALELQLGLARSLGVLDQAYAGRNTKDVRIDRHHLLAPHHCAKHVGRLATDARQTHHTLDIARHFAPELLAEHTRHSCQVASLVIRVGDAADVWKNLFGRGLCHILRRRESLEEGGRGEVHALVGALRRENHRHEQLVGRLEVQFGIGRGHMLGEPTDDSVVSLSQGHTRYRFIHIL